MAKHYEADVIIIGGGIVGCATGYYLAQQGADVLLVEKRGIGAGATGRSGGGVRQSARETEEIPLAMESVARFPTLSDELGVDLEYTREGNLRLVEIPDHVRPMQVDIARQQAAGLDLTWLGAEEVRELVPDLKRERVFGASYCPTDGHCNPFRLVTGFFQAANREGLQTLVGYEVDEIHQMDSGEAVVLAGDLKLRARTVVIAAGAGAHALCLKLGFDLPLAVMNYESMITEPLPPLFPYMFGVGTGDLFFRQTRYGGVHFGGGVIEEVDDTQTTGKNLQLAVEHMIRLLPPLRQVNLLRTWGGVDPNTPDRMPIIDRLNDNVILAAGFCGHGLAIGPTVGRYLAEWIGNGDGKPGELEPFRRNRFEGWLQTRWTPSGSFEAALKTEGSMAHTTNAATTTLAGGGNGWEGAADVKIGNLLLAINPDLCTGCRMCEMACVLRHDGMALPSTRIQVVYPSDDYYIPLTCIHCEESYCMEVCSFDALVREGSQDIVQVIAENCTSCMLCVYECPYGGITYVTEKETVVKCDLCGGDPACATYCPTRAITFVPLDEDTKKRMQRNAMDNLWALVER